MLHYIVLLLVLSVICIHAFKINCAELIQFNSYTDDRYFFELLLEPKRVLACLGEGGVVLGVTVLAILLMIC